MLINFWHLLFFDPVYNGLVFFIDTIPGGDVGLAIIAITVLVKLILLPLSIKAARTQVVMRELDPKLKALKEEFKNNREEQGRQMMALYKEAGLNPLASIFLILLQLPIIFSLYYAVYSGGGVALPAINTDLLYAFVPSPATVDMIFLGLIDVAGKSWLLAVLAVLTQFIQAWLTIPKPAPRDPDKAPNLKDDFAHSMHLQMRYMMPIIIVFAAYFISAAIALYFVVSNLFAIAQEYLIRRQRQK